MIIYSTITWQFVLNIVSTIISIFSKNMWYQEWQGDIILISYNNKYITHDLKRLVCYYCEVDFVKFYYICWKITHLFMPSFYNYFQMTCEKNRNCMSLVKSLNTNYIPITMIQYCILFIILHKDSLFVWPWLNWENNLE